VVVTDPAKKAALTGARGLASALTTLHNMFEEVDRFLHGNSW